MNNLTRNLVEIYNQPITGRLFVVGDLHGCYHLLMQQLHKLDFNFNCDLLVALGDLVDRGPHSLECFRLINKPWFKTIRGNHEQTCIEAAFNPRMKQLHTEHGGEWLYQLPENQQQAIVSQCQDLPVVLEIQYRNKTYGFVHADIHVNDWNQFKQDILKDDYFTSGSRSAMQIALWSRGRVRKALFNDHYQTVTGVDEIYLGHTIVKKPYQHENCFFIDTGAVLVVRSPLKN